MGGDMEDKIFARIKQSLSWMSVQVTLVWGFIWFMYSQLPADVMKQLVDIKLRVWIIDFTVPGIMGLAQVASTYVARIKKQAAGG